MKRTPKFLIKHFSIWIALELSFLVFDLASINVNSSFFFWLFRIIYAKCFLLSGVYIVHFTRPLLGYKEDDKGKCFLVYISSFIIGMVFNCFVMLVVKEKVEFAYFKSNGTYICPATILTDGWEKEYIPLLLNKKCRYHHAFSYGDRKIKDTILCSITFNNNEVIKTQCYAEIYSLHPSQEDIEHAKQGWFMKDGVELDSNSQWYKKMELLRKDYWNLKWPNENE